MVVFVICFVASPKSSPKERTLASIFVTPLSFAEDRVRP